MEMPQSRSTVFLKHHKERLRTNNDKTNVMYKSSDAQTRNAKEKEKAPYIAFDEISFYSYNLCLFIGN